MLQQGTPTQGILARMPKIVVDAPPPDELQKSPAQATELSVVNSEAALADVARLKSSVARPVRAGESSALQSAASSETVEVVFARAFRDAISPTFIQRWLNTHDAELIGALRPMLQRWTDEQLPKHFVDSHKAEIIDALSPIFRRWMDEHLPKLVQRVLIEELRRASTQQLGRR